MFFCQSPFSDEVSVESSEPVTEESSTTSTSTTTTIAVEEPFALDEFGLELVEPPIEMQNQIKELMNFVEKRVGLEFISDPNTIFIHLVITKNIMHFPILMTLKKIMKRVSGREQFFHKTCGV